MKIVQVGQYPISADCIRGGVEASVYGLAQELLKKGHEVLVFDTPRINGITTTEPLAGGEGKGRGWIHRYVNPGSHNVDQMKCVPNMVQDILTLHPDIVHIHGTSELTAAIYTTCQKQGLKLMLTIHGLARIEKKNKLCNLVSDTFLHNPAQNYTKVSDTFLHRLCKNLSQLPKALYQYIRQSRVECNLLEAVDWAIVDTGYLLDALREYPVKHMPELYVIPQGANEKFYTKVSDTKLHNSTQNYTMVSDTFLHKSAPITPKITQRCQTPFYTVCAKTVLCVGAFGVRKSQIELVRAFEQLRSHGVEAQLVLCGVVAEQDYFNQLKSVVSASAYKDDITIKENLPFEQLIREYQHATIFALHSQEESQGIVFAEAMAMGLPVVSTRVGGIPYVVEDGVCGILTEYGDVAATAVALDKLLTDSNLREKMSVAAMDAAEKYRWSNIAEEIVKLY